MSGLEEFISRRDYGLPIMEALMKMSDTEIKNKVRDICGDRIPDNDLILGENSAVIRTIHNEKPQKIEIAYYDVISITPFSISFNPEPGENKELVAFGPHFVL